MESNNKLNLKAMLLGVWVVASVVLLGYMLFNITTKLLKAATEYEINSQSLVYSLKDHNVVIGRNGLVHPSSSLTHQNLLPATTQAAPSPCVVSPTNKSDSKPLDEVIPSIALIIGGVGLSASTTDDVMKLPDLITIGLSPYAQDIKALAQKLTDLKHQVVMNIPMEPVNYPIDDPGPYALLTGLLDKENIDRLDFLATLVNNSIGFYSMDGEKFTLDAKATRPILEEIKRLDMTYVYGAGASNESLSQMAEAVSFPLIVSDAIIDNEITEEAITAQLNKLEELAKKNGTAVGIGHPYPLTIAMVEKWVTDLYARNLRVVGLKEIIELNQNKK